MLISSWGKSRIARSKKIPDKKLAWVNNLILWELASGKMPYEGMTSMMLIFAVVMQAQRMDIPPETPLSYAKLIAKCWAQRAEDRPTIEEIVEELEAKQGEANRQFAA